MRRSVLVAFGMAAVALAGPARPTSAQPRAPRITVVLGQDIEPYRQTLAGFRRALARHAPAPEYRVVVLPGADGTAAARLDFDPGSRSDLILAIGGAAARAVRARAPREPVVVAAVLDSQIPPARGEARPALTGVSMEFPFAQQFQALRAVAPRARRVGTLYARDNRQRLAPALDAAREAGLTLTAVEIASVNDLPEALAGLLGRIDILWAFPDATVFSQETAPYIILETLRRRVPFMGLSQNFVKAGSLLSLYCDFGDIGAQAGAMARDILDGRRPAGGEIVPPRKALLAINLRVADVIGLGIPAEVRRRANSIFE